MAYEYILSISDERATLETVGGKGVSLARLTHAGLPVPGGFCVTTAAYRQFVAENNLQGRILAALEAVDPAQMATLEAASTQIRALFETGNIPADVAEAIRAAYADLENKMSAMAGESRGDSPKQRTQSVAVAVRSSATAEDLPDLSFAGQQETWLNVRGADAVQEAVKRCWASLWTARAIGYRARLAVSGVERPAVSGVERPGVDQGMISLAVVVQTMVPAEVAGIMFTANPINGRREEVVINAAWGLGEAIVGGQVSPDTIVADKATGQVKQLQIADKAVMTVPVSDGTTLQPVAESRRKAPVLTDAQVAELVRLGRQIEACYGAPQDIEWCWADAYAVHPGFSIVQSRPITMLGRATPLEVSPPTEWKAPHPKGRYVRNDIVELMADPLTPLFGTLGRRVINVSIDRLLTDFFGKPGMVPEEMIVTVNGYAYNGGAFTAGQIWQILWGSVGIMKRMFTGMEQRWSQARAQYESIVEDWRSRNWREFSAVEILRAVPEVLGAAIAYYYACLSGLIPAAWITEGLFTGVYDWLIRCKDGPPAVTFLLGSDSKPILAEKSLYDLSAWAGTHQGLIAHLSRTPATQLAVQIGGEQTPAGVDEADWREWRDRFRACLQQYGGMVYDLDFAKPTPADDPTPMLEACKLFLSGQGSNPHVRQQAATERRERAMQAMLSRLKGLRLSWFRKLVTRAHKYAPLREDGLADVGLGYPLLRQMLLELGRRFVEAGAIEKADDVFWLVEDEVEQAAGAIDSAMEVDGKAGVVRQRQAVWKAQKQVTPPVSLPLPPRFLLKMLPAAFGGQTGDNARTASRVIRGVACSPGSVTATARVLHGPQDFDQMKPGDVLVAAITTPAWTPLFAMAAAIVTDIGGPLSHGSIVAREYGIPAVLGTGVATRRLKTGDRVRVDGRQGLVEILEKVLPPEPLAENAQPC